MAGLLVGAIGWRACGAGVAHGPSPPRNAELSRGDAAIRVFEESFRPSASAGAAREHELLHHDSCRLCGFVAALQFAAGFRDRHRHLRAQAFGTVAPARLFSESFSIATQAGGRPELPRAAGTCAGSDSGSVFSR